MSKEIKRFNKNMEYRRFGKTEVVLSAVTLGGMRYVDGWAEPRNAPTPKMIEQCAEITKLSLDAGVNHIETAYGYGKSEHCYGVVLNDVLKYPRDSYYLMTKSHFQTKEEVRPRIEEQLKALKTSYFDFYAWHGVNNEETFEAAVKKGTVKELLKLKDEGVIKHVGFSTHGMRDILLKTVATDLFEFANIHYYYFNQRHRLVVDEIMKKDMGLFIISPNDKGGQLFNAPQKIKDIVSPFTPIQWNANFCLSFPEVHTLSFGMTEASHVEEMKGVFKAIENKKNKVLEIKKKMDEQVPEPYRSFDYYMFDNDPSKINVGNFFRMWLMWKFYDMESYAAYRYNMYSPNNHFIFSAYPMEDNLKKLNLKGKDIPEGIDLIAILKELHEKFYDPKRHSS